VIEPGKEPPDFLISSHGEVSPDGQEHFRVVQEKLDEMHTRGPTLTEDDLKGIRCRTLVMVGDDDEIPSSTPSTSIEPCPTASWR
jgi:hypothetical protein